ncbi:hypothetical protein EV401DRAFT_180308 [Pisolithus croceorrhizus]|nr:hypothetical protein EV401DRAFT_180308 [Pisolithus croceorrhizus]
MQERPLKKLSQACYFTSELLIPHLCQPPSSPLLGWMSQGVGNCHPAATLSYILGLFLKWSASLALHGSHCYPPVMWLETFCETLSQESPLETLWGFYYFCSSELPTAHRSLLHRYFAVHLKYVPKMVFRKQKLARSAATFYISRMVPLGIRFRQALPIIAAGKYSTSFNAHFIGMGRKRLSEVPFFLSYCFLSSCVLAVDGI